tara:strand:- start:61 stop:330 length:270 start_codon:yes stop_codon:yes gene_type:complete
VDELMARLVPDQDDPNAHRRVSVALMQAGLILLAINAQVVSVSAGVRLGRRLADDKNLLVAMILMRGDARGGTTFAERIAREWPDYVPG